MLVLYAPCCVLGPWVYGDSIRESIINSIQITWIQQVINISITLHVVLAVILMFNPLNQEAEELFGVPHGKSRFALNSSFRFRLQTCLGPSWHDGFGRFCGRIGTSIWAAFGSSRRFSHGFYRHHFPRAVLPVLIHEGDHDSRTSHESLKPEFHPNYLRVGPLFPSQTFSAFSATLLKSDSSAVSASSASP